MGGVELQGDKASASEPDKELDWAKRIQNRARDHAIGRSGEKNGPNPSRTDRDGDFEPSDHHSA